MGVNEPLTINNFSLYWRPVRRLFVSERSRTRCVQTRVAVTLSLSNKAGALSNNGRSFIVLKSERRVPGTIDIGSRWIKED